MNPRQREYRSVVCVGSPPSAELLSSNSLSISHQDTKNKREKEREREREREMEGEITGGEE